MDVLVIHLLNALLYASVLFLIAGGLSLIYGVMRIVNMAHGNLYAFENFGSLTLVDSLYPTYNSLVIGVGIVAATFLWAFIYKTRFGVVLRATSQNMRMASALGVNVNRVYIEAFTLGCFMAGLGGAIIVPRPSAGVGMGGDAGVPPVLVGGGGGAGRPAGG